MYNRYNRTRGIGVFSNPKAEIETKGLLNTVVDNFTGGLGSTLLGGLFGSKNAKTAAQAQAQDVRTTETSNEFFQQLQQAISQMDKSVAEKLFGTSNTTDVINQLQTMQQQQTAAGQSATDQTQTTIRGDAAANNAVLQNIMQLSGQFSGGGQQAMDAAIAKTLRSGAGALAGVGNRSGTFGDTTTAILQNDLTTRAAEAGVLAQQNAQTAASNSLAQLMQALQGGQEQTIGKAATTNTQNTNTTGTTQNTGTNTSNTTTTQDRTAQEKATEQSSTGTTGSSTSNKDTFQDALKDKTAGIGTSNPVVGTLGQGIGTQPTVGTGTPMVQNPLQGMNLQLPALPGQQVNMAVMGQPAAGGVVQPAVVNPTAGLPAQTGPIKVNPLDGIVNTTQPLDPNNPLAALDLQVPGQYLDKRFAVM